MLQGCNGSKVITGVKDGPGDRPSGAPAGRVDSADSASAEAQAHHASVHKDPPPPTPRAIASGPEVSMCCLVHDPWESSPPSVRGSVPTTSSPAFAFEGRGMPDIGDHDHATDGARGQGPGATAHQGSGGLLVAGGQHRDTRPLRVGEEVVCHVHMRNRADLPVDSVEGVLVVRAVAVPALPADVPRGACRRAGCWPPQLCV
jgi:hypothetical protein